MIAVILITLIMLFIVQTIIFFYCKNPEIQLESTKQLYDHFLTHKEKYTYTKLKKSRVNEQIKIMFSDKSKLIFCERELYKKKDFLLTLSKFIDLKINKNNTLYRTKNNMILIDQIASVIASDINKTNECKLFYKFNKLRLQYNLKQKEVKIFKILLGQKLLKCINLLEIEIKQISKILLKSGKTKRLKKYNKQIFLSAEIYSIYKFNPNSSKLLHNFNSKPIKIAENFFYELLNFELKIKIILAYLTSMFS